VPGLLMGGDAATRRRGLHLLLPARYCNTVTEVTVEDLRTLGIKAVLLDLDNTLVAWQRSEVPADVFTWLADMRDADMGLYLISNTRFGHRLRSLSERLGIPFVRRAWKPRKRGFVEAMSRLGVDPSHTAMIGDQMFTDVLGGNRLGLYTVMVKPIAKREFIGTRVSRMLERIVLAWFALRGEL
jgi:uncharacterized protein